jgi:hypothetical protein
MDFNKFVQDDKTASAIVRKLEIIGEATKNIPKDNKMKYKFLVAFLYLYIYYYQQVVLFENPFNGIKLTSTRNLYARNISSGKIQVYCLRQRAHTFPNL